MLERKLETNRLIIRRIKMSDCESIYRYMSRPDVVKYLPEDPLSLVDVEKHQKTPLPRTAAPKVLPPMKLSKIKWTFCRFLRRTSHDVSDDNGAGSFSCRTSL